MLRVIFLIVGLLVSSSAFAERKVALLIGNAAYTNGATALRNPPNDVALLEDTLNSAGFDVTVIKDAARGAMSRALADFEEKAAGADVGLIYYSGHGIELGGENFLIPVDATLATDRDVKYEAIELEHLLEALAGATKLKLVLLDACRDNPFLARMKRSLTRGSSTKGLARIESQDSNVLIGYATAPGDVALDGDGESSPYASALSRHLVVPGSEVDSALRAVARDVYAATNGRQRPFITGSLFETVMLGAEVEEVEQLVRPEISLVPSDPCRDAAAHWAAVSDRKDKSLFEEHIRLFGQCAFASTARTEIATLTHIGAIDGPTLAAETAPETECDRLAAHPDDVMKLSSVKGLDFWRIPMPEAMKACEAATNSYPGEPRLMFQLGRALQRYGEDERAMEMFRSAAGKGHTEALTYIGALYRDGEGVTENNSEAVAWFKRAAEHGSADAMYYLGHQHEFGFGVDRNEKDAETWYRRAAEHGQIDAVIKLSLEGSADLISADDAARYIKAALKRGSKAALDELKDNSDAWSLEFKKALQEGLRLEGVYNGAIDGNFGPGTLDAVETLYRRG